jgi:hypothetical protein
LYHIYAVFAIVHFHKGAAVFLVILTNAGLWSGVAFGFHKLLKKVDQNFTT